jgi:hypothetical protein
MTTTLAAFSSAHGFFHSSTWYVVRNLTVFFLVVLWIATVYWVRKDARRRIDDRLLVWVATLLGCIPILGPLIYMLFRPPEYLEDIRERELEIRAMEKRIGAADLHCPVCRAEVDEDFLLCPVCTTRLRAACQSCGKPLGTSWQVCPYCATPIPGDDTLDLPPSAAHERRPRQQQRTRRAS